MTPQVRSRSTVRRRTLAASAAILLTALAACGDDGINNSTPQPPRGIIVLDGYIQPGLTFLGALSATVPVNLPAVVRLPTFGRAAGAVAVTEGPASAPTDPRVWAAGAFVPGVPGVAAAVVTPLAGPPGAVAIDVSVGSGAYVFTVWAAE